MSKQKKGAPHVTHEVKSSTADVVTLINERRKIDDWITALNAKREQTPPHVFQRVMGDYETRLRAVVDKLASHTSSLGDEVASLKKRLGKLDEEISEHRDERDEIEVRGQVGELTPSELGEALRDADDELAELAKKRDTIEADVLRVTEFFTAASGGAVPASLAAKSEGQSRTNFDELSFLKSVVGDHAPAAPAPAPRKSAERAAVPPTPQPAPTPPPPPPPPPPPVAEARPASVEPAPPPPPPPAPPIAEVKPAAVEKPVQLPATRTGEIPMEKRPAEQAAPAPVAAKPAELVLEKETEPLAPAPRPARKTIAMEQSSMTIEPHDLPTPSDGILKSGESAPSLLEGISSKASADEKPFAANVASNNPLSLKSSAKGSSKTLKCRECGTMNDPTEWYCEKCGAELSGL